MDKIQTRDFILLATMLTISACTSDQSPKSVPAQQQPGQGFTNSSDDDNGVTPVPNNGSQNFGRKW